MTYLQGSGSIPIITTESVDDFKTYTNGGMSHGHSAVSVTIDAPEKELTEKEKEQQKITWTTMTPQQISMWIDKYVICKILKKTFIYFNLLNLQAITSILPMCLLRF